MTSLQFFHGETTPRAGPNARLQAPRSQNCCNFKPYCAQRYTNLDQYHRPLSRFFYNIIPLTVYFSALLVLRGKLTLVLQLYLRRSSHFSDNHMCFYVIDLEKILLPFK